MPAPSLVSMAQRAAARDIACLQDVGDMSYELLRPVLRKIANPEQLRKLEVSSPHLADHDSELWKAFIARDIPEWREKMMAPKDPRSWWKVYAKLMRAERRAKEEQEEALMAKMKGINQEKEAKQVTQVHKVLKEPVGRAKPFVDGIPNRHVTMNGSGQVRNPVLKNAKTGREMMNAIRKQAAAAVRQKEIMQPAKPYIPSAKSQISKSQVALLNQRPQLTAAAKQMASERRPTPQPRAFVMKPGQSAMDRSINEAVRKEREQKEARLRALTTGKTAPSSSPPTQAQARSVPATLSPRPALLSPRAMPSRAPVASPPVAPEPGSRDTASPAPPLIRKRPAGSIFMPAKRAKV